MDKHTQKAVLFVSVVTSFLTAFVGSSINVALPTIQKEFSLDAITLTWVSSSYLLATACFLLPFGKISDLIGRKKIFVIGLLLYTFFSLLTGFSLSVYWLLITRIFQGIGASMIFGTSTAIITSVFPVGERGRAMGWSVSGVYLGLSFGPFLGGIITHHLGWRAIFFLNVPFGVIISILVFTKLKGEWVDLEGGKFDYIGSILYLLSLALLMYGFSNIKYFVGNLAIFISVLLILVFYFWERNSQYPILNVKLFTKNPIFAYSNLAALINYSATFSVGFLLSIYLQYIKSFDPSKAGFILALQPLTQAIFSSWAGGLSDKIEPRIVASCGMGLTTIGLLLLSLISSSTPIHFILISLLCLGFGFALFSSPNTNAIMSSVEKQYYGVASATVSTMRLIGQMLSLGLISIFVSAILHNERIKPSNYPLLIEVIHISFLIFGIFCGIGIFASVARGKVRG
ncbi:MAG: MFS transporter [Candidatus Kapaibacteriales bacterium]